jgi:hypothetical protein
MKFARRSLAVPVWTCAMMLPVLLGASACGEEAPLPIIAGAGGAQNNTAGSTPSSGGVIPTQAGTGADMPNAGTTSLPMGGGGGQAGSAIATAGSAGTGGSSQGGVPTGGVPAGGAPPSLKDVAAPLDGAMLVGKCLTDSAASVCQTSSDGCPPANPGDPALSGAITTDKKLTLAGDPNKEYSITLHVQGEVESKRYNGGQDQNGVAQSPKADGFCVGGTPTGGDAYNVYMVRVSSPEQDYFLNSLQTPGVSNHTTYGIDYVAKITAKGGAEIRLVAADSNCSMIKNCGPMENNGNTCAAPIVLANVEPSAIAKNTSFDFSKAFNGQWIVLTVTDVTSN